MLVMVMVMYLASHCAIHPVGSSGSWASSGPASVSGFCPSTAAMLGIIRLVPAKGGQVCGLKDPMLGIRCCPTSLICK